MFFGFENQVINSITFFFMVQTFFHPNFLVSIHIGLIKVHGVGFDDPVRIMNGKNLGEDMDKLA